MKLKNVKIDAKRTVAGKMLLTDVTPAYVYEGGMRTDKVGGYKYEVALPSQSFEKLIVKIEGEQRVESPETYQEVTFDGLNLFLYWSNGDYVVGATATDIHSVTTGKA